MSSHSQGLLTPKRVSPPPSLCSLRTQAQRLRLPSLQALSPGRGAGGGRGARGMQWACWWLPSIGAAPAAGAAREWFQGSSAEPSQGALREQTGFAFREERLSGNRFTHWRKGQGQEWPGSGQGAWRWMRPGTAVPGTDRGGVGAVPSSHCLPSCAQGHSSHGAQEATRGRPWTWALRQSSGTHPLSSGDCPCSGGRSGEDTPSTMSRAETLQYHQLPSTTWVCL